MSQRVLVSRLGTRSQTVVPKAVREILRVKPGDQVGYLVAGGRVELVKIAAREDNPFACFDEWAGEADSKGYASL